MEEKTNENINTTDDVIVEEVDIDFPEYYFTRLSGNTEIFCNYESGFTGVKTIRELYNESIDFTEDELGKRYAYAASPSKTEIINTDFSIIEPEKLLKTYTVTFSNGYTLECGQDSMFLMCNGIWAPISKLEIGDALFNINFRSAGLEGNGKAIMTSYVEIVDIVSNKYTKKTAPFMYGLILSKYNILLGKTLNNEKDISFIAVQQ